MPARLAWRLAHRVLGVLTRLYDLLGGSVKCTPIEYPHCVAVAANEHLEELSEGRFHYRSEQAGTVGSVALATLVATRALGIVLCG